MDLSVLAQADRGLVACFELPQIYRYGDKSTRFNPPLFPLLRPWRQLDLTKTMPKSPTPDTLDHRFDHWQHPQVRDLAWQGKRMKDFRPQECQLDTSHPALLSSVFAGFRP